MIICQCTMGKSLSKITRSPTLITINSIRDQPCQHSMNNSPASDIEEYSDTTCHGVLRPGISEGSASESEGSASESEDLNSEETTRCVMSVSSSSSSCSEDAGSATEDIPDILTEDGISPGDEHDDSNPLKIKYPQLYDHLTGVCRRLNAVVRISKSFLAVCQEPLSTIRVPNDVICDALILSPKRPVTLLTFSINGGDKITKYNSKAARCLITSVRKSLFPSFSVVNGVVDMATWQSEEGFYSHLDNLESDARVFSVDAWLAMDSQKHDKLVAFLKRWSTQNISHLSELNVPSDQFVRHQRPEEMSEITTLLLWQKISDLQRQISDLQRQVSDQQRQISDQQRQISDHLLRLETASDQRQRSSDVQKTESLRSEDSGVYVCKPDRGSISDSKLTLNTVINRGDRSKARKRGEVTDLLKERLLFM